MSSLASTIVPIHSDASTSTSVTASPMELLETPDPTVEFKIPLSGFRTSGVAGLEAMRKPSDEGAPVPEGTMDECLHPSAPTVAVHENGSPDAREGPHVENKHPVPATIDGKQSTVEGLVPTSPEASEKRPAIRLDKLKDVISLEQYLRSQASSLQDTLDRRTLEEGLNRRLLPILSMAYEALLDCYQSGDQVGFANLYQTCEDLQEACKGHILEPVSNGDLRHPVQDPKQPAPRKLWFEKLPEDCQEHFLDFLTRLRADTDFLADRLSALSFAEFTDLSSSSFVSQSSASVFRAHNQRKTSGYTRTSSIPDGSPPLEKLRRFPEGDPFFVLFHCVFDSASGSWTHEYAQRIQVWSTACARVITEGKPGSDDFTIATLDAFSQNNTWCLAPRLETYIGKMLQDGAFLLNPVSKGLANFNEPLEIRNANAAIATSKFFDKALKELLGILLDASPANMTMDGQLDFIRYTLQKIPTSEIRTRARSFIVSRWYISSFLSRILSYPESNGIMMNHHVSTNARSAILKEIASRLQKQVFDAQFTWKSSTPVLDPEMHALIKQLLSRFEPASSDRSESLPTCPRSSGSDERVLMLSVHDAMNLVRSLFPGVSRATVSANPSTAGSSTLIPDSIQDGGRLKSNSPSLSEVSSASSTTLSVRNQLPWLHYKEASPMTKGNDSPRLSGPMEIRSEDLDNRLNRVYGCLTSLVLPRATIADVSARNWAFFTTDIERKVRKPHAYKPSVENHVAPGERATIAQGTNGSMSELRLGIIQLLTQEDLKGSAPRLSSSVKENDIDEVTSMLDILISGAMDRASINYDYAGMHYWWQVQRLLHNSEASTGSLLQCIWNECQESIGLHDQVSRGIEKQLHALSSLRQIQVDRLHYIQERRKALRMKMWYALDVRHSSTFEDALHVTQALRAMANTSRPKQSTGVTSWARQRLKNVTWHDRSTAQTVEALTEPNEYSGTCKLNDDQAERTTRWMTRHSIENFCRGEERIQRFCFEIQRCVNKLTGPTLLESPVLWSSRLFEREKQTLDRKSLSSHARGFQSSMESTSGAMSRSSFSHLPHPHQAGQSAMNDTSKSSPVFRGSSPKEPERSRPFHTSHISTMTPDSLWRSSASGHESNEGTSTNKADGMKALFTTEIKQDLYSLILSDLGYLLWHDGTETDIWVKLSSLDDDLTSPGYRHDDSGAAIKREIERHAKSSHNTGSASDDLRSLLMAATGALQDSKSRWQMQHSEPLGVADDLPPRSDEDRVPTFPYRRTYKGLLERFSRSQGPQSKLRLLHELELLVSHSIQHSMSFSSAAHAQSTLNRTSSTSHPGSIVVPRTKATSFEEVIANCTERRAGTMRFRHQPRSLSVTPDIESFGTNEIVNAFLVIFRDLDLRPSTLFRDLQYIAAFVPAEILDQTLQGKAFWDAGLAALALKQELCDAMITRATNITNYHISVSSSSPSPPPAISPGNNSLANTTLQDAAHLWTIAAKEGSATAARELGLLYLTHPELLPRTTLQPFSKPKEVFRTVGVRKDEVEEGRLDPVTFAVVFHWMEVAANGGDRDARDFLRGNGEWGMGR
ncbi:MAG: hypothetical protein LQ338_007034 [Usnochroma carphineum]|nr:MAG: hypothetical protein LQ338_007034 [Usnochroma carphineum]